MEISGPTPALAGWTDPDYFELFNALLDVVDLAVTVADADGTVMMWGRGGERVLGVPADAAVGRPLDVLFPEASRLAVRSALDGIDGNRTMVDGMRADGMELRLSVTTRCCDWRPGSEPSWLVVISDVSEQEETQAALADAESRIHDNEAWSGVGSWLWDVESGAVQWSQQCHRIHGVEPQAFDGTLEGHLAVVHVDDRARVGDQMTNAVTRSMNYEDRYRIVSPTGEAREVRVYTRVVMAPNRAVRALRGTVAPLG